MKPSFILLITILLCGCINDQRAMESAEMSKIDIDEKYPVISFEVNEIDLGTLNREENGYVSAFFEFSNTGETPLVINKIDVSCGCIEADYVKTPIMKGESGKIKVVLNLNKISGYFHKKIYVISNAEDTYEELLIKGNVRKNAL